MSSCYRSLRALLDSLQPCKGLLEAQHGGLLGLGRSCSNYGNYHQHAQLHSQESPNPNDPPAFVFDIDGVLIRGKRVLPAAKAAMRKLMDADRWRFPVCFITNGGGVSEATKAEQLSSWLDVPVNAAQVILSHTPMRQLVPRLAEQPVLVAGRFDVVHVAHEYGFKKVLSTQQLGRAMPSATPFSSYPDDPLVSRNPCPVKDLGFGTEAAPIAAVLVMTDPSDWYRDAQLILDVVTGCGVLSRDEPIPGAGPVEVYFSNPDFLWANDFSRSRLGQGAFAAIVEMLHAKQTRRPLPHVRYFGKPHPEPYRLAEKLLHQQALELGLTSTPLPTPTCTPTTATTPTAATFTDPPFPSAAPFSAIFAVGDNPAADVRGATAAGRPWTSILVKTGVFRGPGLNCPIDPADIVVDDVLAAVDAALHRTRSWKWHSMR